MDFSVRLSVLSSTSLLVFFSALFLSNFLSLWFYFFLFFSTLCISCCFLAFRLRPITNQTSSPVSLKVDISSSSGKFNYDVFLSFRGTDTRKNFTDHLYTALVQRGIRTFRDDEELVRGESIAPNLRKAIEESRYVIAVFSPNYADSAWCLNEIAEVTDCMKAMEQKVLPVFYHVDPAEVRWQTGDFGKAFKKQQRRYKGDPHKIKRWKDALSQIASLSGWDLQDGYESKVIKEIVEVIFTELNQVSPTPEDGLVGMDFHLNQMLSYLDIERPDVRIVGICGMGGIGKSTIAQVVYARLRTRFAGSSFLENVREVMDKQGAIHLQEKLLSDLLTCNVNVQNSDMGKNIMRQRLHTKKVLIILDDVDDAKQLKALCDRGWYGPGSRIIITSRNEHLLTLVERDQVYNVDPLTHTEALQLFRMKAFKKDKLIGDEFLKLSEVFVKYTNGLPLAIDVLGSSVKDRSVELWLGTLDRLKKNPDKDIIKVLKVSFDGLTTREKNIFLDIACFFKGESIDRVRRILQGSDALCPDIDLKVLQEKSMVVLFGNKLWMHDLIQEMGWEVVREKYPEEPEKHSRLWIRDEIVDVFEENKATGAIQSIFLQAPDDVDPNDTFSKMTKLRLLYISNVKFSRDIKYLSKKLQFLYWDECPLNSFPEKFQPDYLVELHMLSSCIKQLWTGERGWGMLRLIDMSGSQYLMSTPDFTEVPNLEKLVLTNCTSLVKIHQSLGTLKKLVYLDMGNCTSIENIPAFTALESLQYLMLSLCSGLKVFPEITGNMESLLELHLDGTTFEELPPSIFQRLHGLTLLNLTDCKNLLHLPNTIRCLTSLKSLYLTGCAKLDDIAAKNLNGMEYMETLFIGETSIRNLSFIVGMESLRSLSCQGCKYLVSESFEDLASSSLIELDLSDCNLMDGAFLDDLSSLTCLRELNLSGNCFVRLPENISQLSKLETLTLSNCRQLQLLPKKLPLSLLSVHAQDCTSLTDYPNQIKVLASRELGLTVVNSRQSVDSSALPYSISWAPPENWDRSEDSEHYTLPDLRQFEMRGSCIAIPHDEVPKWFGNVSTRNAISIPIPGNLTYDYKWEGFVGCAIFSVKGHTALSIIQPDPDFSSYSYQMTLETDVMRLKPVVLSSKNAEFDPYLESASHLLVTFHMSRSEAPHVALYEASVVQAIFETTHPSMVVKKCAIRLVYDQDEGWSSKVYPWLADIIQFDEDRSVQESAWRNHSLKWEKFIPPSEEEESTVVVLRKNLESVLPRYLEAVNDSATFNFNLSGSPGWFHDELFRCKTRSSFIMASIKVPENLHKSKKWMGFAMLASLVQEVGQAMKENKYEVFVGLSARDEPACGVPTNYKHVRPFSEEHHQLLVCYIARAQIPEALFTQAQTQTLTTAMDLLISIEGSSHVKVATCGFRIVYQEDIQGFSDTIIQCSRREGSLQVYDKVFVEDWIQMIRNEGAPLERMTKRDSRTPRQKYVDMHSQKYRNLDWFDPPSFGRAFDRADISKWKRFMPFINQGAYAETQLSPNLFDDDNWLGFAVCCWLSHDQYPNISLGATLDDSENVMLHLRLHSDAEWNGKFDSHIKMLFGTLSLTYFNFIPRTITRSGLWRQCKLARVTMRLTNYPCLTVHSSAIRLVYKEDVGHLIETLALAELP